MGLLDWLFPPVKKPEEKQEQPPADDRDPAVILHERLSRGELPDDALFSRAWSESANLDVMIDLLLLGSTRGVYGVDSTSTWSISREDPRPARWLFRLQLPDGAYVRVDVTREGGVEGLKKIVPALAPRAVWAGGIDKEHDAIADPLSQLMFALKAQKKPLASWQKKHTLASAWAATCDSIAMRNVLERCGRTADVARAQEACHGVATPPRGRSSIGSITPQMKREMEDYKRALADAVRAAVPQPPPLDELVKSFS